MPPSVRLLESHSGPVKGLHFEDRVRDPSAVAGASVLATLSNFHKEISLLPPPSSPELPTLLSPCKVSDNCNVEADMDSADRCVGSDASSAEKASVLSMTNKNINHNRTSLEASVDADIKQVPGETHRITQGSPMLAGSATPELDLTGSISKILDLQQEVRESKGISPILLLRRLQLYKDGLRKRVLKSREIDVSFESFPYYLRCRFLVTIKNYFPKPINQIKLLTRFLFVCMVYFLIFSSWFVMFLCILKVTLFFCTFFQK